MSGDLVERLRAASHFALMSAARQTVREAADTIERLNREVSALIAECQSLQDRCVNGAVLTVAEREAIESAVWDYEQNDDDADCAKMVFTLRGLLERLR